MVERIECFLRQVDKDFPVAISEKIDLHAYAEKLVDKATLCLEYDGDAIGGIVAGYTDNLIDNRAYISVVAVSRNLRGKGVCKKLIHQFIFLCKQKQISSIHLYTSSQNIMAIKMYEKIGFQQWKVEQEMRPDDIHFIYRIGTGEGKRT